MRTTALDAVPPSSLESREGVIHGRLGRAFRHLARRRVAPSVHVSVSVIVYVADDDASDVETASSAI